MKKSKVKEREWFRLPEDPAARALVIEIEEAFRGVHRTGGISWAETVVLDFYGSEEQMIAARSKNKDRIWQDLVDDPEWREMPGVGGFAFLDPIGFRYYLPVAMVQCVREGESIILPYYLERPLGLSDMLSLLDEAQRICVRHFLEYMILATDPLWRDDWEKTLRDYSQNYKPVPHKPPKKKTAPKRRAHDRRRLRSE